MKRAICLAPFNELADPRILAELVSEIGAARPDGQPFDVVAEIAPGGDPAPWARAGATWIVTEIGSQPILAQVREVIDAGPGQG